MIDPKRHLLLLRLAYCSLLFVLVSCGGGKQSWAPPTAVPVLATPTPAEQPAKSTPEVPTSPAVPDPTATPEPLQPSPTALPVEPPFDGTIFLDGDIITSDDPSTLVNVSYRGEGFREMFDRRIDAFDLFNVHLFEASFEDGVVVEVQVNTELGPESEAETHASFYAYAVGQLPEVLREDLQTLWIHAGTELFGGGNNNILIHTGQTDLYLAEGILEETLVHEAAHTSLDATHAASTGWMEAQRLDSSFISTYARDNPAREDIAETFLLYLAVRYRSDRITAELRETIVKTVPARMSYFDDQMLELYPFE